jgi:hypothetical protein
MHGVGREIQMEREFRTGYKRPKGERMRQREKGKRSKQKVVNFSKPKA